MLGEIYESETLGIGYISLSIRRQRARFPPGRVTSLVLPRFDKIQKWAIDPTGRLCWWRMSDFNSYPYVLSVHQYHQRSPHIAGTLQAKTKNNIYSLSQLSHILRGNTRRYTSLAEDLRQICSSLTLCTLNDHIAR